MAKKAKKPVHPMPRLGWKDQLFYWSILIFTCGGSFVSLLFPLWYRERITDRNPDAIASTSGEGYLHSMWLFTWLFVCWVIVLVQFHQHRRPIFGRKDIKYGPPAYPRIYPLLMRDKPKYWQSPKAIARKKKRIRNLICLALVTLLFSAAMYPRSYYGRWELQRDGTMVVYNAKNEQTEHYSLSRVESVCLDTTKSSGGRYSSGSWYARMTIFFRDGETCSFSLRLFGDDWSQALRTARELKERYGSLVRIEDTDNLWKVILDTDMSAAEEEMLYELYEVS